MAPGFREAIGYFTSEMTAGVTALGFADACTLQNVILAVTGSTMVAPNEIRGGIG